MFFNGLKYPFLLRLGLVLLTTMGCQSLHKTKPLQSRHYSYSEAQGHYQITLHLEADKSFVLLQESYPYNIRYFANQVTDTIWETKPLYLVYSGQWQLEYNNLQLRFNDSIYLDRLFANNRSLNRNGTLISFPAQVDPLYIFDKPCSIEKALHP